MKSVALGLLAIALVIACHDDEPTCYVGDLVACTCSDGATGYAACLPSQDGFGACPCDGKTPTFDAGAAR